MSLVFPRIVYVSYSHTLYFPDKKYKHSFNFQFFFQKSGLFLKEMSLATTLRYDYKSRYQRGSKQSNANHLQGKNVSYVDV
jgi:hypothetical protein